MKYKYKYTDKKIVIAGSNVEVSLYDGDVHAYDLHIPRTPRYKEPIPDDETEQQKAYRLEEERLKKINSRRRSMLHSKSSVIRLVNSNIWRYFKDDGKPYIPIFLTLTFADDIKDIKQANYIFAKFLKRLNYEVIGEKKGFLKYVAVIEFQDKNDRGVIHYHVVFFNLKFIWADTMASIWGEGFIKIKKIGKLKNIGTYITKYMSKNFEDARLDGKKRYFPSLGLYKPKVFLEQQQVNEIYKNLPKKYIIKERDYWSRYDQWVKVVEYVLPRERRVDNNLENFYDLP